MRKQDSNLLVDVVGTEVLDAWKVASEALVRAGVRHVVIGGLAVSAHGHPSARKAVDFLVGEEAFHHHPGGLVTMNPAIPIAVNGVAIDYLSPRPDEGHLASALAASPGTFIDVARLVYMKLKASRMQDRADVVGLVKAGLDVDACRGYLLANAPALVTAFDDLVAKAALEQ